MECQNGLLHLVIKAFAVWVRYMHARFLHAKKKEKNMFKLNQQQLHVGEIWAACNSVMRNHDAQHRQLVIAGEIPA